MERRAAPVHLECPNPLKLVNQTMKLFPKIFALLIFVSLLCQSSLAQSLGGWMTDPPNPPSTETAPKAEPNPKKVPSPAENTKPANDPSQVEAATEKSSPRKADAEAGGSTASPGDATLELARKAQNPISSMISVPFQYNANFGVGPNDDTTQTMNIQPVVPVPLSKDLTLVNRAIIPISYVPNSAVPASLASGAELGLGDTNLQFFFVPTTKPGKLIWGVGPTVTLPTATADKLGSGKWLAGVNAVGLTMKGKWVLGALVNQQWSVAGNSARDDVSFLTVQPFINKNFEKGWYATTSPIMTSNWEARPGEKWTIPVGGGAGRIFAIGEQKVNVSLQAYGNVVKPTNGPDWTLRCQFTLLFP